MPKRSFAEIRRGIVLPIDIKEEKMKQIRSITALILASIMALAMFGGCAGDNSEDPTPSPDTEIPASEEPTEVPTEEPTEVPTEEPTPEPEGETYEVHGVEEDFNFEYFDDTGDEELFAFSATVPLPVGWELRDEPTEDCFPFRNLAYPNNDRKCIYDAEGNCVGVVAGFGYEPSGYEEQKYYPATFGHISYVALDEWCVSAECDPSCLSTISVCFYDMQQWCEPEYEITEPEVYNPTIIVENLETHCYISIEFLHGLLSTETITEIAESAVVYSYGDPSKSERKTYEVRGVEADFNFEYLSADEPFAFSAAVPLPVGWELRDEPTEDGFPFRALLPVPDRSYNDYKCIYDAEGNFVGVVAGYACELAEDDEMFDNLVARYSNAAFGNTTCIALNEKCVPAECDPSCLNTISFTYYGPQIFAPAYAASEFTVCNPTIISENLETHCYIVIEFLHGLISEETIIEIAQSAIVHPGIN